LFPEPVEFFAFILVRCFRRGQNGSLLTSSISGETATLFSALNSSLIP
jgi:hypothetical protein